MTFKWFGAFTFAVAMTINASASAAPSPSMQALQLLEPGQWELRDRDADKDIQRLCVTHLEQLLQFRRNRASCKRFIVRNTPRELVVTYDCGASGNGRTALRTETPRLAQIQIQGIANGAPFETAVEARRVGICH